MACVLMPCRNMRLQVINHDIAGGFFIRSSNQTIAPEDSAWQAIPHFFELETGHPASGTVIYNGQEYSAKDLLKDFSFF